MTKLFRIILFVHPTPDYYNLHIHPAILTHGLESVLNIVPEWKIKKASFVCFGLS